MKIEVEIEEQEIVDALIAAFEGGSNYWYFLPDLTMISKKHKGKSMSEKITLSALEGRNIPISDVNEFDEDSEPEVIGHLSRDNIKRGVALYLKDYGVIKADQMDADDGDTLLQLIVFGEIVYG